MAYIGKQPVIGNFVKLDAISVVNGQASYTMQNGGANFTSYANVNQFLVSLNGILQSPTDSFTVSGSTITFASNLVTGDVIDFIIVLGNTLDVGVPSDNTVSLAKLTATGTKDATTFLRGDNTFAEAGGGIEEVDCFGVNDLNINTFTSYTLTSSNTSRISSFSNQTFSKTGTGITIDSNGKVAFPSTGTYYITFDTMFSVLTTTTVDWVGGIIRGTTDDGSNIYNLAENYNNNSSPSGNTDKVGITTSLLFTVSDTSNDKVYFQAVSTTALNGIRLGGSDPTLKTKFTIIKLV